MGTTTTPLICSECGKGNYVATDDDFDLFICDCGHAVTRYDIVLDEGERLFVGSDWVLCVVSAD